MSWTSRTAFFKKIENEISSGEKCSLQLILQEEQLSLAIGQRLPILSKFIMEHLTEIIDYGVGAVDPPPGVEKEKCFGLLNLPSSLITEEMSHSSEIQDHLCKLIGTTASMCHLMRLIQISIDSSSGHSLFLISDPASFISSLLSHLSDTFIYQFLISFCLRSATDVISFLSTNRIDESLLKLLNYDEEIAKRALQLIYCLLRDSDHRMDMVDRLSHLSSIKLIFDTGANAALPMLSALAFHVIIEVWMKESTAETEADRSPSNFDQIVDFFNQNCFTLCKFVLTDSVFSLQHRWAAEIINCVVSSKNSVDEELRKYSSAMIERFFVNPTNDFLHSSVSNLVSAMMSLKAGRKEFLEGSGIMEKIMSAISQRDKITASFWGHLMEMSSKIDAVCEEAEVVRGDKWRDLITGPVSLYYKGIKSGYGGDLPKIPKCRDESFKYQCHFTDSTDSLDEDQLSPTSSSSSSSEEDEEWAEGEKERHSA